MNNINFDFFCGIDISKNTLDFTIINHNKNKLLSKQVSNNKKGVKNLLNYIKKLNIKLSHTLFCCENTGIYTLNLANSLHEVNCNLWIENAIEIKKSQGLTRGKNDLIDSFRIACYALRFNDKCNLWNPPNKNIEKIKLLFALRDRIQKNINMLEIPLNETKSIIDKKFYNQLKKCTEDSLKSLKEDFKKVNKDLEEIIFEDESLKKNYEIVKSVPCIGKVSAIYLLMCTENFTKIKTYRKAACYAGIAPFEHRSGTSIRGKTRISQMGNKYLKKLLHLGTLSILKNKNGELYKYYERKKNEGKHIMTIINNLRNKILNRVFACINNGIKYDLNYEKNK